MDEMQKEIPTVLWLKDAMSHHLTPEQRVAFEGLYQQALEMEKMNIIYAFSAASGDMYDHYKNSRHYYDETFTS
jgi:hypothetical protein